MSSGFWGRLDNGQRMARALAANVSLLSAFRDSIKELHLSALQQLGQPTHAACLKKAQRRSSFSARYLPENSVTTSAGRIPAGS